MLTTLFGAGNAMAVPVQAHYVDDLNCDSHGEQFQSHELGSTVPDFPWDERIQVTSQAAPSICVPDDGFPNDFLITITNLGSVAYENLFFVVDSGGSVGNYDGYIEDLAGPPGAFEQAFRIDGTVTAGANNSLISESMGADEIFMPGETWQFLVTNFTAPASQPPSPIFGSAGTFAATSSSPLSSASIVATPVPEPATGLLVTLGLAALGLRRARGGA